MIPKSTTQESFDLGLRVFFVSKFVSSAMRLLFFASGIERLPYYITRARDCFACGKRYSAGFTPPQNPPFSFINRSRDSDIIIRGFISELSAMNRL